MTGNRMPNNYEACINDFHIDRTQDFSGCPRHPDWVHATSFEEAIKALEEGREVRPLHEDLRLTRIRLNPGGGVTCYYVKKYADGTTGESHFYLHGKKSEREDYAWLLIKHPLEEEVEEALASIAKSVAALRVTPDA